MGIFGKKKTPPQPPAAVSRRTLLEDIPIAASWIVKALNSSGYQADYTASSTSKALPAASVPKTEGRFCLAWALMWDKPPSAFTAGIGTPMTATRRGRSTLRWSWKTGPGCGRWSGA